MLVYSRTGASRGTLTPAHAVASIGPLGMDAIGSCGDGQFDAVPSRLPFDIERRDRVIVQYRANEDASFATLYQGIVVGAGMPQSTRFATYRLVGLRKRLYEVAITHVRSLSSEASPWDVGMVVRTLVRNAALVNRVNGLQYHPLSGGQEAPTLGFTVGLLSLGYASYGDVLDDLAARVGTFVVPVGETYVYYGRTFTAGETVPAVRWGVTAGGHVMFVRPLAAPLAFLEGDPSVSVEWDRNMAENVSDRAVVVYASEWNGTPSITVPQSVRLSRQGLPVPVPLVAVSDTEQDLAADTWVPLEAPLDFMVNDVSTWTSDGNVEGAENAFDGDAESYATFGVADPTRDPYLRVSHDDNLVGGIVVLDVLIPGTRLYSASGAERPALVVRAQFGSSHSLTWAFAPEENVRRILTLPVMPSAEVSLSALVDLTVQVVGAEGARVYDMRVYRVDEATNDRLAHAFVRPMTNAVGTVTLRDAWPYSPLQATQMSDMATVTTLDAEDITARVERIETTITAERGVVTTFRTGLAFDADLEAERVLLEVLARRAAGGT